MKSGVVCLVGRPNVGKSTLMNHLIGQKIAITSEKPQTTRDRIRTVYTDKRGQILFDDTPGLTKPKNRLGEYMTDAAEKALEGADAVLWIVEADPYVGPADREVAGLLDKVRKPVVLVINKVDKLGSASEIEGVMKSFSGLMRFEEIVPVSALKSKNTDSVLDALFKCLPEGPMYYDEDTVTNETMRDIAAEMIREQALRLLRDEVPHGIAVTVERMREREDDPSLMDIDATIICERDSHKGMIIGKGGQMLKRIGTLARRSIEDMTGTQVNLKLWVKVRRDWRDDVTQLKSFGYDRKKLK